MKSNVCVIGTGYVGMASAIGLAELGHNVTGYDILPERVRSLQRGITPYREEGIEKPLKRHVASGQLRFFEDLPSAVHNADFVIICVGTPARSDGSCDLSHLYDAARALLKTAPQNAIIVLRSTVPPGTTEDIERLLMPLRVVYAPEFLREGNALADFLNPDRIVVGAYSERTAETYLTLFASLAKPAIITSLRNAELIKGSSNAFLAMKISFANQIANLCDGVGADALEVLRGIGADSRIGPRFLEPGIGFGGPCFEKDVKSLLHVSAQHGTGGQLFAATLQVNEAQPLRIIEMLEAEAGVLRRLHVGVWGLAFKAGTDDTRDSIAMRIVEELIRRGATVTAYDPEVEASAFPTNCNRASSALMAADCDALLILTEWPEFKDIDLASVVPRIRKSVIIDGRNILDPIAIERFRINYRGIGRRVLNTAAETDSLALAG